MAIGNPTIVGSIGSASTPASLAISSTGAIATHDLVAVAHYANGGNSLATSITDDSSNVYRRILLAPGAPLLEVYICYDAIAMTTGHAVTIPSFTNSALRHGMYVTNVTGMLRDAGVFDLHTGANEHSTGTSSPSMAIKATAAAQMLLLTFSASGGTLGTYTPTTGFTALTPLTSNAFIYPEYKVVAAPQTLSSNPTWVNSVLHNTGSLGFVGIPAANTSRQAQGTLLGVGV